MSIAATGRFHQEEQCGVDSLTGCDHPATYEVVDLSRPHGPIRLNNHSLAPGLYPVGRLIIKPVSSLMCMRSITLCHYELHPRAPST